MLPDPGDPKMLLANNNDLPITPIHVQSYSQSQFIIDRQNSENSCGRCHQTPVSNHCFHYKHPQ